MKKALFTCLLAAFLLGSFLAGSWYGRSFVEKDGRATGRQVLYYVDPMNPANISDRPGTAPCGMAMEPVYDESIPGPAGPVTAGAVKINTEKQQIIGVRSGPVEMSTHARSIRTLGRVTPEENKVYTVTSSGSGWIWDVFGSTTGTLVKKDDVLATFYDKAFLGAEQAYFFGLSFVESPSVKSEIESRLKQSHATREEHTKPRQPEEVSSAAPEKSGHNDSCGIGQTQADPHSIPIAKENSAKEDEPVRMHSEVATAEPAKAADDEEDALSDYENMNQQGWPSSEPILSPYSKASSEKPEKQTAEEPQKDQVAHLARSRMAEVRSHERYLIDQAESAVHNLIDLGMSDAQIKELNRTREWTSRIEIRSPATGHVISRDIYQGLRFDRGAEFFRIADLTRVWVIADVFEREALHIKPGDRAIVTVPRQAASWEAKVSEVLPIFDPDTRTFKVRLETDNPDFVLKPDMFVDVEFIVNTASAISVPVDAVINSGMRKTVFVDLGNGFFEPREVKAGPHSGGKVQVTEGLMPGEKIVLSGAFLLDSEAQMKRAAARRLTAGVKDPVCGMSIDPKKAKAAGLTSESGGKTYYFCEPSCKANFDRDLAGKLPGEQAKGSQSAQNDSAASPNSRARNEVAAKHVKQPRAGTLIR